MIRRSSTRIQNFLRGLDFFYLICKSLYSPQLPLVLVGFTIGLWSNLKSSICDLSTSGRYLYHDMKKCIYGNWTRPCDQTELNSASVWHVFPVPTFCDWYCPVRTGFMRGINPCHFWESYKHLCCMYLKKFAIKVEDETTLVVLSHYSRAIPD